MRTAIHPLDLIRTSHVAKHRDSTVLIDADTRASFNFDPDFVNGGYGAHEIMGMHHENFGGFAESY